MMACVAELSVSQMECNMFDGKIRELVRFLFFCYNDDIATNDI